jgi:putative ABC transport system permease protein
MAIPLKYNLRNLIVRKVSTLMTVSTVALVVAVFLALMSLANGLNRALIATGSPENLIILRRGSTNSEINSQVTRQAFQVIQTLPGIARDPQDRPLASAEVCVLVNIPRRGTSQGSNVTIRGVSDAGFAIRPQIKLVSGRMFKPGIGEAIASTKTAERFSSAGLGETLHVGRGDWQIVGLFDAGGTSFDSEIWADAEVVRSAFDRQNYSSVLVRAESVASRQALANRVEGEQRLQLEAKPEPDYYKDQSGAGEPIKGLGIFVAIILGIGASFGGMNTMYAAVANRTREIGTLRALGFSRGSILLSFVIESVIIALIGGVVGCLLALPVNGIATGTTNFNTFSELTFSFQITPDLIGTALLFAAFLGLLGGLLPSRMAARLPIIKALREF